MSWDGYFSYDGSEIINVARTEAYVTGSNVAWFRPLFKNDVLALMLGDGEYTTAEADGAPWVDDNFPESYDFFGFYPLSITGIDDSTRTSTVVESLMDGGTPGRIRNATRQMVFNGVLLARSECGADYGMRWLRQALLGGPCGTTVGSQCNGSDLCFLSCAPARSHPGDCYSGGRPTCLDGAGTVTGSVTVIDTVTDESAILDGGTPDATSTTDIHDGGTPSSTSTTVIDDGGSPATTGQVVVTQTGTHQEETRQVLAEDCLDPLVRSLRRVLFNTGPTILSKREADDGSAMWQVEFSGVAGAPQALGVEVSVMEGFMGTVVTQPGVVVDLTGFIYDDTLCETTDPSAIFDPLCPALDPPPGPPNVPLGCYTPPASWHRRQFTIPETYVPAWGEVVPKIEVHARAADLRNLRVRFYADVLGSGSIAEDPCAFCGDFVVSYIPLGHTLVIDGAEQVVYVIGPGDVRRRADSLVFQTDGTPFVWPSLTCGFGYIVTVDLPTAQTPPVVDLSLYARAV